MGTSHLTRDHLKKGYRLITIGYVLLALGSAGGLFLGFNNNHKVQQQAMAICKSAQENREILRLLIKNGDPANLGSGEAGYEYWSKHPRERKAAHLNTVRILKETVPPISCTKLEDRFF